MLRLCAPRDDATIGCHCERSDAIPRHAQARPLVGVKSTGPAEAAVEAKRVKDRAKAKAKAAEVMRAGEQRAE